MIENIRGAFNELLNEVSWMDEETRKVAKEKVSYNMCVSWIVCIELHLSDLNSSYHTFCVNFAS